ncbi:MAG TPA: hypothetical protein VKU82_16180 [Planctomycetaceae bacterium]|nr:hypothetical protein [Planctomycetaceae bacterium]
MKGVPGLLMAVGLGIVGMLFNLMYLAQKGQELEMVHFIGINEGVAINPGDKFNESQLMKVPIPKNAVGNLEKVAIKWDLRSTVFGQAATKSYSPGEILLWHDLRTPPGMDIKKLLAPDERALWIPVDTRTFVPALVNAGDMVSFIAPRMTASGPLPAAVPESSEKPPPQSASETIGPFRILALGDRLGTREVLRASGTTAAQENVIAIAVKWVDGEFEEKAQKILEIERMTNNQQLQVILHPGAEAAKGLK